MGWLTDNLGKVILFVILLLVVLAIMGMVSGKFPDLIDAVATTLGVA